MRMRYKTLFGNIWSIEIKRRRYRSSLITTVILGLQKRISRACNYFDVCRRRDDTTTARKSCDRKIFATRLESTAKMRLDDAVVKDYSCINRIHV